MKRHISFPSIEQFKNIVSNINRQFSFVGLDENQEPIYDYTKPKPKLTFKGTVKLHGTNAGVCYNAVDGMWTQSRENIITPLKDNAGFAAFVETNKLTFQKLFDAIIIKYNLDYVDKTVCIYGEWAGTGIQKGVGISNLPKAFYIFGVKIAPTEKEEDPNKSISYWVDSGDLSDIDNNIYNIEGFPTYEMDIDFNEPEMSQNKLIEMTIAVEDECPVTKALGSEGIGEGIVWSVNYNDVVYRFKVKGEKHAKSKVKTLAPVDENKLENQTAIASLVTPEWRLEQMLEAACDFMNGGTLDRSKLGEFIRLVMADVVKEELQTLKTAGLELKDVAKQISENARKYFFEQEKVK